MGPKSPHRTHGFTIALFVLSVGFLSLWCLTRPSVSIQSLYSKLGSPTLACADAVKLSQWGIQKHVHPINQKRFRSASFAKAVAKEFATRLDPEKSLFLESEVTDWANGLAASWTKTISDGNCQYVEEGYSRFLKLGRQRLAQAQADFSPATKVARVSKARFAKTLPELQTRLNRKLLDAWKNAEPALRKTYASPVSFLADRAESLFPAEKYYATEVLAKAVLGAMDPYSTYLPQNEFDDLYQDLSAEASGVGVRVQKAAAGLWVEGVVPGSPADKAGIKKGNLLTEAAGTSLVGLSLNESLEKLKGEAGSSVELTVKDKAGEKVVSLTRELLDLKEDRITVSRQSGKGRTAEIAWVKIPSFYGRGGIASGNEEHSVSEDVRASLLQMTKTGEAPKALVLDLRGNPGGYLEEAVSVAGLFLGPRSVVGVADDQSTRVLREESDDAPAFSLPTLVLIDQETASAGEVLAAALKDHQRAITVGDSSTFGKGSVQRLFPMSDPFLNVGLENPLGVIKVTTSVFYSPMGHSPSNGGVTSQIVLADSRRQGSGTGMTVPELEPLATQDELVAIRAAETRQKELIVALTQQSEGRRKDLPSFDVEEETLQIAADLGEIR